VVQKQDYFFTGKIKEGIAKGNTMLSRSDNKFFYEKPTLSHKCYLFITKDSKKKISLSGSPKIYERYMEEVKEFIKVTNTCISFLEKEDYFTITRLDGDEILKVISNYF